MESRYTLSRACTHTHAGHTSAEKHLTGIPNALANPKSASFSSPFCKKYIYTFLNRLKKGK